MANSNEQKAIEDLKTLAPEFAQLTEDFLFGDIWKCPGLSQRDKSLITVTQFSPRPRVFDGRQQGK